MPARKALLIGVLAVAIVGALLDRGAARPGRGPPFWETPARVVAGTSSNWQRRPAVDNDEKGDG